MKKKEETSMEKAMEALGNKDFIQAKKCFEELANQGNVNALCNLGIMHLNGDGVDADPFKAKEYFLKASKLKCIVADYYLGVICEEGLGGGKNEKEAVQYFLKVIDHESKYKKDAEYRLGIAYAEGRGVEKNGFQAMAYLSKAGSGETEGHKGAQFYLGMLFLAGGLISRDKVRALASLTKAAAEPHGHTEAQYYLGIISQEGYLGNKTEIDENKARAYFLKAAEKGHKDAQYRLGVMLKKGQGGNRDEAQAIEWLSKAAKRGHTEAESLLCQYADNCGVGAESTSREMPKLIEAATQVLGEEYEKDLQTMFHELWHIGIPELKDEVLYHYEYEMYPSLHSVPVNKQAGIVYLYIEQGILHYQVLKHLELCSGALNVEEGFNLDRLKDVSFSATPPLKENIRTIYYRCNGTQTGCNYEVIDDNGQVQLDHLSLSPDNSEEGIRQILLKEIGTKYCLAKEKHLQSLVKNLQQQIIENGHLEPSYEDNFPKKILRAYNEIVKEENKILEFLNSLMLVLENAEFKEVFKEPTKFESLRGEYIGTVQKLNKAQQEIGEFFKSEVSNSSQLIGTLNKAYTDRIDFKDYYNMVVFIQLLHNMIENEAEKEKIESFCQRYSPKNEPFLSLGQLTNLPPLFTGQFMTRRKLSLDNLARYFRKKHDEFCQLESIFFIFDKLATIANRAQPQLSENAFKSEKTNLDTVFETRSKIEKEKNELKFNCFKLITPIFNLLMLEIGQIDMGLILQTFAREKEKLRAALSDLKKLGATPSPIFAAKIEQVEKEINQKNDLAYIIASIADLITSIPPDLAKEIESRNIDLDTEFPEQMQEIRLPSPKERRSSRVGNLFGMLSPRQTSASLDNRMKDAGSEDLAGSAMVALESRNSLKRCSSPLGGLDDESASCRSSQAPSLSLDNTFDKGWDLENNQKKGYSSLVQSYSRMSSFGGALEDLEEDKKVLSSRLEAGRVSSLSLPDKANKDSNLENNRKKGRSLLAESCDSISRSNGNNGHLNSFFVAHRSQGIALPARPLPDGDKNKNSKEDSNKKSGFPLFHKMPSPHMGRQSKLSPNTTSLMKGAPRCNSMGKD